MSTLETFANNITERVRDAIQRTKDLEPEYFNNTLAQRSGLNVKGRRGSFYPLEPAEIEKAIMEASWYKYDHTEISKGCRGAFARIPGNLGVVELALLAPETMLVAIAAHDREPGYCDLLLEGTTPLQSVTHTTLILGLDPTHDRELMFTFHPGDPIKPSDIVSVKNEVKPGQVLTLKEAQALGFNYTKVV